MNDASADSITGHPLWLVGFRPFFALAVLAGALLPLLWMLAYTGVVEAPAAPFSPMQWHGHEMFFGFGWAVMGGFLLTATKNWVSVRGYHGAPLMFLAGAWLFERVGMWFGGSWPPLLFHISNNLFLATIVAMILWTLIRHRGSDSYRDNYFFLIILPLFIAVKNLMLIPDHFAAGTALAVALFRVAFLVMLERTLTQFMKSVFQVTILRHAALDTAIKGLAVALVAAPLLPATVTHGIELALAALLLVRFVAWRPDLAFRRIELAIMYLGYLAIVLQLLLDALQPLLHFVLVGTVSVHLFTFGVMGLIIPSMLIRISKGHTGRKVAFDALDKALLWIMILALALRIVAPQVYPAAYRQWLFGAAACWFVCFVILGWRYVPFLAQPRVDGKEH